jgi:hypothetical protein
MSNAWYIALIGTDAISDILPRKNINAVVFLFANDTLGF